MSTLDERMHAIWKRAVGEKTIARVRHEGAAVAFGLMGMAEAIRANVEPAVLPEPKRDARGMPCDLEEWARWADSVSARNRWRLASLDRSPAHE